MLEEFKYTSYEEHFRIFILLGLALLLIEWILRTTIYKSILLKSMFQKHCRDNHLAVISSSIIPSTLDWHCWEWWHNHLCFPGRTRVFLSIIPSPFDCCCCYCGNIELVVVLALFHCWKHSRQIVHRLKATSSLWFYLLGLRL